MYKETPNQIAASALYYSTFVFQKELRETIGVVTMSIQALYPAGTRTPDHFYEQHFVTIDTCSTISVPGG